MTFSTFEISRSKKPEISFFALDITKTLPVETLIPYGKGLFSITATF